MAEAIPARSLPVKGLYWFHLVYLGLLPGSLSGLTGRAFESGWHFAAWLFFGLVGIPLYAAWIALLYRFPQHLLPALFRAFSIPLLLAGWWLWTGASVATSLVSLFLIEWGAILLGWFAVCLVPPGRLDPALFPGEPPKGLAGHLTQIGLALIIVGGLTYNLYRLSGRFLMDLTQKDLLLFAAAIASNAGFIFIAILRNRLYDSQAKEGAVVLLTALAAWIVGLGMGRT